MTATPPTRRDGESNPPPPGGDDDDIGDGKSNPPPPGQDGDDSAPVPPAPGGDGESAPDPPAPGGEGGDGGDGDGGGGGGGPSSGSPTKKRARRGRKVWPKKKKHAPGEFTTSSESSDNDDDKDMDDFEAKHPRYDKKKDKKIVSVFELNESSINAKLKQWCAAQVDFMRNGSKSRKHTKTDLKEILENDTDSANLDKITTLAHDIGGFEIFLCWKMNKNKHLQGRCARYLKGGFEESEVEWIDAVAKHAWTWVIILQHQETCIGQLFFSIMNDNTSIQSCKYKTATAAYLDYILVSTDLPPELTENGYTSTPRGCGIGSLLIRIVIALGIELSDNGPFETYLKSPPDRCTWYRSLGFRTCSSRYWNRTTSVKERSSIVQNSPKENITKMVLQEGLFPPRVYKIYRDPREMKLSMPEQLKRMGATEECMGIIRNDDTRRDMQSKCPSTKHMLRLPIGKLISDALKRHHKGTMLHAEAWKLRWLEAWVEQDRIKGDGTRRLRRIDFRQPVDVTFYCRGCSRKVGIFPETQCPQWRTFSKFVLEQYLSDHFDTENNYRCKLIDTQSVEFLERKLKEDFGKEDNKKGATTATAKKAREDRLKRSVTHTQLYVGEVMETFPNIAQYWTERVYPKQKKKSSNKRTRTMVKPSILFEETSSALGGGRKFNPTQEVEETKRRNKEAAKEWEDLEFQTTIETLCWRVNSPNLARPEDGFRLTNEESVEGRSTYWVATGAGESRAIHPGFINKEFPLEFRSMCKEKPNANFQIPAEISKLFRDRFEEYEFRQVSHIKVKFNSRLRRMTYHRAIQAQKAGGKTTYTSHGELSLDWIYENFALREPTFYKELLNADANKVFDVPLGSSRDNLEGAPERCPDAPVVFYQQEELSACVVCSFASALYASGKKQYAELVFGWLTESLTIDIGTRRKEDVKRVKLYKDRLDFVVEKTRRAPQIFLPKVKGSFLHYAEPFPQEIHLCSIVGTDGSRQHVIALWNGWIFDANLPYAIRYCKDSLDWCCGDESDWSKFQKFGKTVVFHERMAKEDTKSSKSTGKK